MEKKKGGLAALLHIHWTDRTSPIDAVGKIRKMLAFMDDMDDVQELKALPPWDAHLLKGDRKGTWSLTVTRNWRLTFRMDADAQEIADVDFEDYH